ncbi:MAG: VCBS repeat-containing protein [Bacteroidota bacterium]
MYRPASSGVWTLALAWGLLGVACHTSPPKLELLDASRTGITFNNQIFENDTFNILSHLYLYNGAGVGVADFDLDGKEDVFFAGNMVSCELYLNRGDFRFEEVGEAAGVQTNRWCTGVSIVDINQDAQPDIYVCSTHPDPDSGSANYLFVHQGLDKSGMPIFEEQAAAYGLDDRGYSTQAAFFDYDLDGDLDMYLLTNSLGYADRNSPMPVDRSGKHPSTDRLYQNQGDGSFAQVGLAAGITSEGWGLGVAISDFNQDGWPDVYVANDFISNDQLYLNQQDGTFQDEISSYFAHNSYNSMGIDVADLTNDGLSEVVVLDMLPDDNARQKSMFSDPNHNRHYLTVDRGYQPQFVRNVLQLNYGNQRFGDIGQLAGIFQTDWSWSPIMVDLDNDGWRDLLITNGYFRDVTDMDYVDYSDQSSRFGTPEVIQQRLYEAVSALEPVIKHNYLYRNQGDLTFEDVSDAWGFTVPSVSHGVAYADFDQDGDLDWVVNNMNQPAFVYENHQLEPDQPIEQHYLQLRLIGKPGNLQGLGSKVYLTHSDSSGHISTQYHEHSLYRGYKSSVSGIIHFGLGQSPAVDSLRVIWPDGSTQLLTQLQGDQLLEVRQAEAQPAPDGPKEPLQPLLTAWQDEVLSGFQHQENGHDDFAVEALLPYKLSQCGPAMAVADADGNGLDDLWIGGARNTPASLFLQQVNGTFLAVDPYPADANYEDAGGLWFDADQDGDLDLYVVSGGNEVAGENEFYQDRLYLQEKGQWQLAEGALPQLSKSGGSVSATDLDRDGDLDLLIAGRLEARNYPYPGETYLLRNEGGTFTDQTDQLAPGLKDIGRVTQALWTDLDQDGWRDLALVGEWMSPVLFMNREGSLEKQAIAAFEARSGWWNSLIAADFDEDGDMDLVAGNLGLNSRYKVSEAEPLVVYAKDYDENGSTDPVMSFYLEGQAVPAHYRNKLAMQIRAMKRRFPNYSAYGAAQMDEVLLPTEREGAYVRKKQWAESSYIENLGNGQFELRALPMLAQVAPTYGMLAEDIDGDSHLDLLLVGNAYGTETHVGQYDASQGLLLKGDGKGGFSPISAGESGMATRGDMQSLTRLRLADGKQLVVAASNKGSLFLVTFLPTGETALLQPGDASVEIRLSDGRTLIREIHQGEGYWSQQSLSLPLPAETEQITITDVRGKSRTLTFSSADPS